VASSVQKPNGRTGFYYTATLTANVKCGNEDERAVPI
jgi:hypothetical protein